MRAGGLPMFVCHLICLGRAAVGSWRGLAIARMGVKTHVYLASEALSASGPE